MMTQKYLHGVKVQQMRITCQKISKSKQQPETATQPDNCFDNDINNDEEKNNEQDMNNDGN